MSIMYPMFMMITPLLIHDTQQPKLRQSTGIKTASKTPRDHGQDKTRPLFAYCNLTKSQHGTNELMKAVACNNEKTLIGCNPLKFYTLRGQLLDIVKSH